MLSALTSKEAEVLNITSDLYPPDSPTEAYQLIDRNGKTRSRTTERCTETTCPAKNADVQVHWHVNQRNASAGYGKIANLAREFPGPGDHLLLPHDVINVGVTPMGGVWAIERVGGNASLRYLRSSSNPAIDAFVGENWTPGMTPREVYRILEGEDF